MLLQSLKELLTDSQANSRNRANLNRANLTMKNNESEQIKLLGAPPLELKDALVDLALTADRIAINFMEWSESIEHGTIEPDKAEWYERYKSILADIERMTLSKRNRERSRNYFIKQKNT